jgi:hypothetical protein
VDPDDLGEAFRRDMAHRTAAPRHPEGGRRDG